MQTPDATLFEPYKGLRPYEAQDSEIFFGRDAERDILIDKILSNKLTLLFAATGVGKSSLLYAAVLPKLKESESLDVVYYRNWSVAAPLEALKKEILDVLRMEGKIPTGYAPDETLSLKWFLHACSAFASEPLVLMLDQFEEFFYYQRLQQGFQDLVVQLSESVNDRQTPVVFVISMREDFALELNAFKNHLPTTLFQNFFRLEKLTREKAREAIEEPVKKIGREYEPELRESLLRDLAEREKQSRFGSSSASFDDSQFYVEPPYLQIVCTQLWEMEKNNPDKKLHANVYQQNGGASGFVDRYFSEVMEEFSTEEKRIASRSFDFLITPYGTKMAYPVKELSPRTRVNRNELEKVLMKLQSKKVLRGQKREDDTWYELYHDIFSRIIYQWNEGYKAKERTRKGIIFTSLGIVVCLMLYACYNFVTNYTNHYLKLSLKTGISDTIEVWRGKPGSQDWFHVKAYRAETGFQRKEVEPDKQFEEKPIPDYDDLNKDVAGLLPVTDRLSEYWQDGQMESLRKLAAKSVSAHDMTRTTDVIQRLASFRSTISLEMFKPHLTPESDPTVRQKIVVAAATIPPCFSVNTLTALLSDPHDAVRTNAVYALGTLGATESVKDIVPLLKDPTVSIRINALYALGRLGGLESVKDIVPLLKDEDASVRSAAIYALTDVGGPESVREIVALLSDEDSSVRFTVVYALMDVGGPESVREIVPLLNDQDVSIRSAAVYALGRLGGPESVRRIVPLLNDQDASVRSAAVYALVDVGSTECVKDLLPLLRHQDMSMRSAAVYALGRLGATESVKEILPLLNDQDLSIRGTVIEALGRLGGAESVKHILPLLHHQDVYLRRMAIEALGRAGGAESVKEIVPLLKDRYVHDVAVVALGKLGGAESVLDILQILQDHDDSMRSAAVEALGIVGGPGCMKDILPFLKDQNVHARSAAVVALGKLAGPESVKDILPLLRDKDVEVRTAAVEALGRVGGPGCMKDILPFLKGQNANARSAAVVALGKLAGPESVKDILPLLKDQDQYVQDAAFEALGQLQATEPVKDILSVLKDLYQAPRGAIVALGKLGSTEARRDISLQLKDRDTNVRCAAIEALGRLGGTESVRGIAPLLKDRDAGMRSAAVSALGKIGGTESARHIVPLLKDKDADVRRNAVIAIGKTLSSEDMATIKEIYTNSKEDHVRLAAAAVLLKQNEEEALEFIKKKAKDTKYEERVKTAEILGDVPSKQGTALLLEMLDDERAEVRESVVGALGNIGSTELYETLRNIATDEKERTYIRVSAIEGLAGIKSGQAEDALVELLQAEETYQFRAIKALGERRSSKALPELKKLLKGLEDRKSQWRMLRDNEPEPEAQRENWRKELESVKPKTYLEYELAYAIARIDPEREGIRLLSHDLAAVREGAWMGVGKTRRTDLLEKLYDIRRTTRTPWERHAAYRAIDHLLIEIEECGEKVDLDHLEGFLRAITDDPLSGGVKTRVEWTLQRLKTRDGQKLDAIIGAPYYRPGQGPGYGSNAPSPEP